MADKNKNGIDDKYEKAALGKPGYVSISGVPVPTGGGGGGYSPAAVSTTPKKAAAPRIQPRFPNSPSFGVNTAGPEPLSEAWRAQQQWGGGAQEDPTKTLGDYLKQAMEMLGQFDLGGGSSPVNYDPQRDAARQQAADNDSRLEAMYRQLRGSIDADASVIQDAYQGAIDSTRQGNSTAQAQTQAATDAANSRNNAVLEALGIQEAEKNIIQEGRDLNTQTAHQIADQASKGQAATGLLANNQATALAHNTNIGNAAGLEGNLQRASNQSRLQALLAEIGMQEQQANASRGDSGAQMFGLASGLAESLLGFDRYEQDRADRLQQAAAELAAKSNSVYDPNEFWNYLSGIQGINGVAPLSDDPELQLKQLDFFRKLYGG